MSVRAHFVKHIKYDEGETFNLWHDNEFLEIFDKYANQELNADSMGMMEISIEDWEQMKEQEDLSGFEDIVNKIDNLFKREDQDFPGEWVRFYCF